MIPSSIVGLIALAAVANGLAAAGTAFLPGVLTGPAFTNGNATGTAIVMLVIATPTLVVATWRARAGAARALVVTLGALAYLAYNDVLLLFATPFNRLFLVYVATLGVTLFVSIATLRAVDPERVAQRMPAVPARGLAIYAWVVIALNAFIWLGTIVPATFAERPGSFLDGMGVATNPVFVEDLAFWLPGAAIVAWLAWLRRPWGIVLIGAWLVYGFMEAVGVATDQWFGSRFDPAQADAAIGAVALFVVVAAIGLVPLALFFRPGSRAGRPGAPSA